MNNVENKNSPKMIIGFVFGLFAGVIGVLFAQYIVGVDEPENISNTQPVSYTHLTLPTIVSV